MSCRTLVARLLLAALPSLAPGCAGDPPTPVFPKTLAELGVTLPIDTPEKLVQVMRAGSISVGVRQSPNGYELQNSIEASAAIGASAPLGHFFNADGVLAVLQPDPAGSNSPSLHLVAVTDAQKFAEGVFKGEENLLLRRLADFRSRSVSTLRTVVPAGQLPRPEGALIRHHSDYKDVNPPSWYHNAAVTQIEPPGGEAGYELRIYLGEWFFNYADERMTGRVFTLTSDVRARLSTSIEADPGWFAAQEVQITADIKFDAFAIDLANFALPAPPANYGLNLLARVPVPLYPSGPHRPFAEGNRVVFPTGGRVAGLEQELAWVVDVSNLNAPTTTVVRGDALPGPGAVLRWPYLYLPDEGAPGWEVAAPPYSNHNTGATLRQVGGLRIYDLTAVPEPKEIGFFRFTGLGDGASNFQLIGKWGYLFASQNDEAIQVIDVEDPTLPIQREFLGLGGVANKLQAPVDGYMQGNLLYSAWLEAGIVVARVTTAPLLINHWRFNPLGGPIVSVRPTDNNLLITTEGNVGGPLRIFDISTGMPRAVSTWSPHKASRLGYTDVDGNKVYVCAYTDGLFVLDISDPVNPREIGHWIARPADGLSRTADIVRPLGEGTYGVFVGQQYVFVTDTEEGLLVFQR